VRLSPVPSGRRTVTVLKQPWRFDPTVTLTRLPFGSFTVLVDRVWGIPPPERAICHHAWAFVVGLAGLEPATSA
jgi:hypothetical protein